MRKALLLSLLLCASAPALAVYKCESDGRTVYADEPCPGGKAMRIAAADSAAAADAAARAARDKAQLRQIEDERRREQAADRKARAKAAGAASAQAKKCRSLAMRKKWSEEDAAAASLKTSEKAKRNARRKAEKYEAECAA